MDDRPPADQTTLLQAIELPKRRIRQSSSIPVRVSDVARHAATSAGTVSRVVNQPHLVSPEVTARVRAAIAELGWVPHGPARALASNRTRSIGAIIPSLANPNIAEMIYGMQSEFVNRSHVLIIGCSEYDADKALYEVRAMVERGIDGVILLGENYPEPLWVLLKVHRIPYMITFGFRTDSDAPYIGCDQYDGAVQATNHLLDLGHTRFGLIAQDESNNDRAAMRRRGVFAALEARGIAIPPERMVTKPWSMRAGYEGFQAIMSGKQPPTALICGNDFHAAGAMSAAREAGLRLPQDLSIVGFDDLEVAAYLSPSLTTVRVPGREIGCYAADAMVTWLESGVAPHSHAFSTRLIVRQSTAIAPP